MSSWLPVIWNVMMPMWHERHDVSNHRQGNLPVNDGFPSQRASNGESVYMPSFHHAKRGSDSQMLISVDQSWHILLNYHNFSIENFTYYSRQPRRYQQKLVSLSNHDDTHNTSFGTQVMQIWTSHANYYEYGWSFAEHSPGANDVTMTDTGK